MAVFACSPLIQPSSQDKQDGTEQGEGGGSGEEGSGEEGGSGDEGGGSGDEGGGSGDEGGGGSGEEGGGSGDEGGGSGGEGGGQSTQSLGYLSCYEMPAMNLVSTTEATESGEDNSGPWWRYDTPEEKLVVITHAFKDGSKQIRNWSALYDGNKKAPIWSAFVMQTDVYQDNNVGRGSWHLDKAVPNDWQHTTIYQSGTEKYHRGHLVASNYRQAYSSKDNYQTFYYTNQALQEQDKFNGAIWQSLESRVVSAAPSGRDTLYVVVGLLFEGDPRKNASAADLADYTAPSHYYKLLMKCGFNTDGSMKSAAGVAYLMENVAHNNNNYDNYATSIDAIEERTGFDFFANVPAELQEAAEKTSAPIW